MHRVGLPDDVCRPTGIYRNPQAKIVGFTTQVRSIEPRGAVSRNLCHKGIVLPCILRLQWSSSGEVDRLSCARDIRVPHCIQGYGCAGIASGSPQISGIDEYWIDDQRVLTVVLRQGKFDVIPGVNR